MRYLLFLLAAAPSWSAIVPVRFEPAPAAPSAVFGGLLAPSLRLLQPPVSVPLSAEAPGAARIAAVGDAGTGDEHQAGIARAMAAEHGRAPFASVLVLGDNVYKNGEPEKFDAVIREPYAALFDGGVRFFPVLGNHDVRAGGGEAQRAYWGAPRWYKAQIGDADVFALDTTILLPRHQKHAYDGALPETARLGREMLAWLDAELEKSEGRRVVVYGHHPLYVSTNEEEKVEESSLLRDVLEPILVKHGVKLYLAGHKHHYERSLPVGGVTHVISGAGGQLTGEAPTYPSGVAATLVARRHFLVLESGPDGLRIRALAENGEVLDDFVLR